MAGTANTFTEYANPAEQQQRLINRLSDWLFGQNDKIYRSCTLVDISKCGGAILIPNDMVIPGSIFDLIIHDPDNTNTTSTIIRAELRWSDINYSETQIKIGFKFENNSPSKQRAIKYLIDHAKSKNAMDFDCSLIF